MFPNVLCHQLPLKLSTEKAYCLKAVQTKIRSVPIFQNCFIKRKKSYFKYQYHPDVEAKVNAQIQTEQQAAQEYLNIAVNFLHPGQSRPGTGGFFMRMYEEELSHMQEFIQYQLMRGGLPIINGLKPTTPCLELTLLHAFQKALDLEKNVTEHLVKLVKISESLKDYQCADFVTSVFLAEQMKSVNDMSHHVTKLQRLCDEHSIYQYDLELGRNYPYKYKQKHPE